MALPYIAILLLGLAAIGGAFLAFLRLGEARIPTAVAVVHGAVAASGVFTQYMGIFDGTITGLGIPSFGLFIVVALLGAYMFSFQIKGLPIPKKVMFVHGGLAVTAYGLLIASVVMSDVSQKVLVT